MPLRIAERKLQLPLAAILLASAACGPSGPPVPADPAPSAFTAPSAPADQGESIPLSSLGLGLWVGPDSLPDPERPMMTGVWDAAKGRTAVQAPPRAALLVGGRPVGEGRTCVQSRLTSAHAATVCRRGKERITVESRIEDGRLHTRVRFEGGSGWKVEASSSELGEVRRTMATPGSLHLLGRISPLGLPEARTHIEGPPEPDLGWMRRLVSGLEGWQAEPGKALPGVFGLQDPKFGGRVFWDHDLWLFPALALLDPEGAQAIASYRLRTLDPAITGRETAQVGWESGPDGRDLAVGDALKSRGAGAAAGWMLNQARLLGLADPGASMRTQRAIAQGYLEASRPGYSGRVIRDVRSIDEYQIIDNDLFLQAGADQLWRRLGFPHRAHLPRNGDGALINYEPDQGLPMQQAAGLLAVWPLRHPEAEPQGRSLALRWGPRVIAQGPAMSASIEAAVLARSGDPDKARRVWLNEARRRMPPPFFLFREKPMNREAEFFTGIAGMVNTALYGFLGIDIDEADPGPKPWKRRLKSGGWISIDPNLPSSWKGMTIWPVWIDGQPHRVQAARTFIKVEPVSSAPARGR